MGWNYLSIPKLQRLHRWSLEMDKQFHPTHYNGCNYLSMLGLKLNHVSKRGPRLVMNHREWRRPRKEDTQELSGHIQDFCHQNYKHLIMHLRLNSGFGCLMRSVVPFECLLWQCADNESNPIKQSNQSMRNIYLKWSQIRTLSFFTTCLLPASDVPRDALPT